MAANPFDELEAASEANPFDQFDASPEANPFDQFDTPEPTQNYFVDKTKRLGKSLAQVPGQFVESVGQMADATGRLFVASGADQIHAELNSPLDERFAAIDQALRTPTPGTALIRDTGREMTQSARDLYKGNYAPDPARDTELGSKVAGSTGSLVASLITPGGLVAKTTTGALINSLGQSDEARQKMLQRGATKQDAEDEGLRQFVLNLPAGALEAVPWEAALKRFGGTKIADAVAQKYGKTALRRISTAVFGQAATEAGEEALQNLWGNAAAKLTYDPTRAVTEGTGEAALIGGLMGGGFGGTAQTTAEIASALDTRQNLAESKKTLLAQQQQLVRGLRPAQMFPVDADGKVTNELPLPPEMARVATERGVFHYNPAQIDEATLLKLSGVGRENGPLGLGSQSKADVAARVAQGDPAVTVTERQPDGTEVKASVATLGTANQTAAELAASKTPGNTVQVESLGQVVTERTAAAAAPPAAPNFIEGLLATDAAAATATREAAAKEEAGRTERQTELAEKKARFEERLAVARQTLADPAASFPAVDGALTSLTSYAEDASLGLTQTQREQALKAQAALQKRHALLAPDAAAAADAAAATRRTEAKLAEDVKTEKVRRERTKLQHLETTGRDLATGEITDLTNVPDEELATLDANAEGLTPAQIDAEQQRRGEQAERTAATANDAGYTLRDLIFGKKAALAAAGQRSALRLKSPAALSLEGGTMAGEHRALGERQGGFKIFSDTGLAEDGLQERLQSLGFDAPDVTTAYALYERALAGEEIRPERGEGQQVDFAQRARDASGSASGLDLRAATPYEISRQDYADLAAFAREVGPLTLQTIAPGDDLSQYPGRSPAGSPSTAEPTGARNLLQLIGAAFGKRVLLVQPRADAKWSAATKPDRANTILINTRKGDPLLALFGHEFGHNLRAQRPELYRAFSRLVLESNPVPPAYRAQKIAQLYPANRINDEWVNDVIAGRFDETAFYRELAAAEKRRAAQGGVKGDGVLTQFIRAAQEWLAALSQRLRTTLEPRASAGALAQIERLRTRLADVTVEYQRAKPAAGYAENPAFARTGADADLTSRKAADLASRKTTATANLADPAPRTDFRDAEEQRAYLANPDNFNDRPYPGVVKGTPLWNESQATAEKSLELDTERRRRKLTFAEIETIARRATGKPWPDFQNVADYDRTLAELRQPGSQVGKFPGGQTEIQFASRQETMDLGSTPLGVTLPNEIRNLAPRWQDKTLAFESSLDKALYYAGGTPGALRERIIDDLGQQTGLSAGEIATLARELRQKLAPLARPTASNATVRVPAQMQSAVRMLRGVDFATGAAALPKRWAQDLRDAQIMTSVAALRAHEMYREAKAGSADHAWFVVTALLNPAKLKALHDQHPDAILAPVRARERQGKNALPPALASAMATAHPSWTIDQEIAQRAGMGHTDATALARLANPAQFDGAVQAGKNYILLDDVLTSGSTINALRAHIEAGGGRVVAVNALAASGNPQTGAGQNLAPRPDVVQKLDAKFGQEQINSLLQEQNIAESSHALTNSQARYLLTFATLDRARAALTAARISRDPPTPQRNRSDDTGPTGRIETTDTAAAAGPSVDFATANSASEYVAANGTPPAKVAAARADIERILGVVQDDQLDFVSYTRGGRLVLRSGPSAAGSANERPGAVLGAAEALKAPNQPDVVRAAYGIDPADPSNTGSERISSIIPALIADPKRTWDIRGAQITTARDVMTLVTVLRSPYVEIAKIILLNRAGVVVHSEIIGIGALSAAIVDSTQLAGVLNRAPQTDEGYDVILSHNHPGGNPAPSPGDYTVTRALRGLLSRTKHNLRDHVVTNGDTYYSYAENNWPVPSGRDPRTGQPLPPWYAMGAPSAVTTQPPTARGADADTRIEPGSAAPWEIVRRNDLYTFSSSTNTLQLIDSLRQVDPTALHIIYLNRKYLVTALERVPNFKAAAATQAGWRPWEPLTSKLLEGFGREGAAAFMLFAPDTMTSRDAKNLMREMAELSERSDFIFLDYAAQQLTVGNTARGLGLMEPGPSVDFAQGGNERTQPLTAEQAAHSLPLIALPSKPLGGEGTLKAAKIRAIESLAAWYGKPITNDNDGTAIVITRSAVKHGMWNEGLAHVQMVPALPQLIRSALKLATEKHTPAEPTVKAVHRYIAALRLGTQLYRVKLTVKELLNGTNLYDHTATQIESPDGNDISRLSSSEPLADEPTSGDAITVAQLFGRVKPDDRVQFATGPDPTARLADVEQRLAALSNSQEDPADLAARGRALTAERDQLQREIAAATREAQAAKATIDVRHPAAVAIPSEPGDAWAMAPQMTDGELAAERDSITEHIHDQGDGLAPAMRAHLNARLNALSTEQHRRGTPLGTAVVALPQIDRQAALVAELTRGRALAADGNRTGNDAALNEGNRLVRLAKARLDEEFPGWDATPAPATKAAAAQPPLPPEPPTTEAAPANEGEGEQSPFSGSEEETMPVRPGKWSEVYGHSSYTPSFLLKTWRRIAAVLTGIRGPIPELPTFPAARWNKSDPFIAEHGPQFYARIAEGERALKSANDYLQRTAADQIGAIIEPLLKAEGKFSAEDYAQLRKYQQQARRTQAEGKPLPPSLTAGIAALNSKMESSPYVLFNRLVFALDLHWRVQNLKDSAGNAIVLPAGINAAETKAELARLSGLLAASPHAALIQTAITAHRALVAQVAEDLKSRELLAADHLANPYYFPHLTLETTQGGKIEERELTPARVRPGTEADFRGYLEPPVGSKKAIEQDYVRAMYYHLVQVGAHNFKADAVRDYFRPYDIKATVERRAKELTKERGVPVTWEQAFNEEFAPRGYVKYGTDSRDAFPTLTINRDLLARRLGVMLTSGDLHAQLKELNQTGVKLLPEDIRESLTQGERETWIVPSRVAEALRGIGDRLSAQDNAVEAVAKWTLGIWKSWKLFMPMSHIRYEYGNVVADTEKLLSSSPGTFKYLPRAAKELRAFWQGGPPSADLQAALKDGVINAITAQELDSLVRIKAFEAFETRTQKAWDIVKRRGSSILYQPVLSMLEGGTRTWSAIKGRPQSEVMTQLGLGDFSTPELSAYREAVTRYAHYQGNLEAIRAGARPAYGGAYWRTIEAMTDSRPGANDAAERKAAAISKATFGDYGDLSVLGQTARDKFIPFYSWMEINFRYHANLLRNLRDMVREGEGPAAAQAGKAVALAGLSFTARAAGGLALRLALPYLALALWNNSGDRDELEKLLSEEDRRRTHLILGRDGQGKVLVVYGNTALMDVMKWISGPKFAQAMGGWLNGKTDFTTAAAAWRDAILPDLANNFFGGITPVLKIPYTRISGLATFPDVTDQRTVPAYDMRRNILSQITDDFTADLIERTINKDYYGSKDLGAYVKQMIFQVRQRDPESWAFYAIKDKANDYLEKRTGTKRDSSLDAPDQQVLRNFRRAIYRGDVEKAVQFYQRLLDYGYTAERFQDSIRSQDPLSALRKENGLRKQFVDSLNPDDRAQLDRAYVFYQRMNASRGQERQLFPSQSSGVNGQMRYQAQPRTDALRAQMQRVDGMSDEEREQRAQRDERRSLQRTN